MNSSNLSKKNKIFLAIFILLIILVPITVFVVNNDTLQNLRSRADLSADASTLTRSLLANQGNDSEQISVAVSRKEKMKALAPDSEKFLLNVIPEDVKKTLPLPAQDQIEKKVEITGVLIEDIKEEGSKTLALNTAVFQTLDSEGYVKDSYQVYLRDDMPLESLLGKVKLKGYVIENIVVPISIEKSNSVLGINTTGNLKIGVVMVNFKNDDSDIRNDFTREQMAKIYFTDPNSVTNYITKTSLGKLNASGDISDVYGWIDLPGYTRKQVCDIYEKDPDNQGFIKAINQLAKQQATARGKVFGDYDIIGYVFPSIPTEPENSLKTNCYWNAITKGIPGDPIVSPVHFLNGDYDGVNDVDHGNLDSAAAIKFYSGILAHEVGHSLGLSHANAILCGDKQIAAYSNCSIYFYGDRFDLIGGAWDYHPHTNARNKFLLGWIPSENQKTVSTNGNYTLYTSSKNLTGKTQSIRIDRPVDGGDYFLDYRTQNNGDGGMTTAAYDGAFLRLSNVDLPLMKNYTGGTVNEWRTKQSYLIDVNKNDNSGRGGLLNPTFKDGMVFNDARNDITIKQLSHDADSVELSIKFNVPPCIINNPTLSILEPSLSGKPGERLTFTFTITNKNSSTCSDATYTLSATNPNGWSTGLSKTSITLSSGSSGTFNANVTSATDASYSNNPFSITITAQDKNNTNSKDNQEIRYSIENVNQQSPTSIPSSPTPTIRPTSTPTPTPTRQAPTPTLSPFPTPIPVSIIPANGSTSLHFPSIKLHGIGNGGDNLNPNAKGNPDPKRKTRILTVELYDSAGTLITTAQGNINFSVTTGDFNGTVSLPDSFTGGNYRIKIKTNQYLNKLLLNRVTITKNSVNEIIATDTDLTAGDANLDGDLDSQDYFVISDCYSEYLPPKNCNNATKNFNADISDDGKVNNDDYGLYIRERSVQR